MKLREKAENTVPASSFGISRRTLGGFLVMLTVLFHSV